MKSAFQIPLNFRHFFRLLPLIVLLTMSIMAQAQNKNMTKARLFLEQKQYTKALKQSDKAIEQDPKSSLAHIYRSQSLFYLYKSGHPKYADGFKMAMKSAERAFQLEKPQAIRNAFPDFMNQLLKQNNDEGDQSFKKGRFYKASQFYKQSLVFDPNDTFSLFMVGECYWNENQLEEAIPYYQRVTELNYSAFSVSSDLKHTYQFKAFRHIAQFHMDRQSWDSVDMVLKMGLEMFPADPMMKGYRYGLYRVQLRETPPSVDFLDIIRKAIVDYPTDSFLLTQENAAYIFLFKNATSHKDYKQADSLLGLFVIDRLERSQRQDVHIIKKYDVFTHSNTVDIFKNLLLYFTRFGHIESFEWLSNKWLTEVSGKDQVDKKTFFKWVAETHQSGHKNMAALMLLTEHRRNKDPKFWDKELHAEVKKFVSLGLNYRGLDYLYKITHDWMLGMHKPKALDVHQSLSMIFVDSLAYQGHFFMAYKVLEDLGRFSPADVNAIRKGKLREISVKDFEYSYYGSRIALSGKKDPGAPVFKPTMVPSNCEPGEIQEEVYLRLLDRVNYFRRISGITKPVFMVTDFNKRSQMAATLFEANKKMMHEPIEGLRCYTQVAKTAAQNSVLVQSRNPALALTAIATDKSPSAGNRRWMLYPLSSNIGYGGSPQFQVFWFMDHSALDDTLLYKDRFVAWPGPGYTPKMLASGHWSFSVYGDLQQAKVQVLNAAGKPLEVQVFPQVKGYGLPTIVFAPVLPANGNADEEYQVNITLKSGKKFSYKVTLFDPIAAEEEE
jgi:tetratricopeptide (TPR) repeat protein